MSTPIQILVGSPLQPGDKLYASYELIHCGDSGSWCYKRDRCSAAEAMVNRIAQQGYDKASAPLGKMREIGGCGFQAFHWFCVFCDFMIARRSDQEYDSTTGTFMYPRTM
eukprot:12357149-Alexandrium_andersonii.AAC.1